MLLNSRPDPHIARCVYIKIKHSRMKPWHKINWQAAKVRRALKLEDDLWRWWQEQDARKEKGATAHIAQADRATAHALMGWSDDGGMAA